MGERIALWGHCEGWGMGLGRQIFLPKRNLNCLWCPECLYHLYAVKPSYFKFVLWTIARIFLSRPHWEFEKRKAQLRIPPLLPWHCQTNCFEHKFCWITTTSRGPPHLPPFCLFPFISCHSHKDPDFQQSKLSFFFFFLNELWRYQAHTCSVLLLMFYILVWDENIPSWHLIIFLLIVPGSAEAHLLL